MTPEFQAAALPEVHRQARLRISGRNGTDDQCSHLRMNRPSERIRRERSVPSGKIRQCGLIAEMQKTAKPAEAAQASRGAGVNRQGKGFRKPLSFLMAENALFLPVYAGRRREGRAKSPCFLFSVGRGRSPLLPPSKVFGPPIALLAATAVCEGRPKDPSRVPFPLFLLMPALRNAMSDPQVAKEY